MDNPSDNQAINQDPMSYKAAKVACQLVESTERFLTTVSEIQQSNNSIKNNTNDHIKRVIQQYEHVCMIINVLESITSFVINSQRQKSLSTAATSASTTTSTALSRIYTLLSTLNIDDNDAKESLNQLGILVQQSKNLNLKTEDNSVVTTQIIDITPTTIAPQVVNNERRELDLKRKQFEEEKEEFERERKRILLDKENIIKIQQKLKLEQQQQQQQQQLVVQQKQQLQQQHERRKLEQERLIKKQQHEKKEKDNLAKQKQQIQTLLTDQFLEQFEKTAKTFAKSIEMDIDNVWESMLLHALPKNKITWAEETIFGRKHTWNYAKQMYSMKYAEKPNTTNNELAWNSTTQGNNTVIPTKPASEVANNIPTAPTAVFAATNALVNATTAAPKTAVAPLNTLLEKSTIAVTAPPQSREQPREQDERRVADYCQHLLSLEMKFYDTIEEYNKRYMRYCLIAHVDLTGQSFIDRYIRSLNPKYRDMIRATININQTPINNINQVMQLAEEVVNAYLATNPTRRNAPYSQNCVHNRNINQAV
jgi:hypothetical protein